MAILGVTCHNTREFLCTIMGIAFTLLLVVLPQVGFGFIRDVLLTAVGGLSYFPYS